MENNGWPSRERRKRSLAEMSQSHSRTLSSSPVMLRERLSNVRSQSLRPPAHSNHNSASSSSRARRQTPNPQNTTGQSSRNSHSLRASAEMEANRQSPPQRRSGIVIDLTSDQEDAPSSPARPRRAARMTAPTPRPPPSLGRSEARLGQVVDLTADDDDEDDTIVITHSRERSIPPPPRARPQLPQFQMGQPGGRATPPGVRGYANANQMDPPRPPPVRYFEQVHGGLRDYLQNGADVIIHNFMGFERHRGAGDHVAVGFFGDFPAMPNGMDYGRVALQEHKPEHVAPPPAEDGFTRSPTENDTAICPSCEEELIHRKDSGDEPPAKKSRVAPSKKDREEHPFWVVKDCGHVFCNKCYQHRANNKISSFRGTKNTLCSVEDCESIIKNKDKWVGVFL